MELAASVALGLALAAACGLRVFVPPLVAGLAARAGWLELSPSLEWLAGTPALAALGAATILEVAAYHVPWLDNLLDALATPVAAVAGTLVAAAVLVDLNPGAQWGLAALAGAGVTLPVQVGTTVARGASSATTGGLANPILGLLESIAAAVISVLAVLLPLVAGLLALAGLAWLAVRWRRRRRKAAATIASGGSPFAAPPHGPSRP